MVATMSPAQAQLDESISTCRFAQRVAMVSNSVSLNEELDPTLMIRRLKGEIKSLRARRPQAARARARARTPRLPICHRQ